MVDSERLLQLLLPLHFERTANQRYSGDLCYTRPSQFPELFEQIQIGSAGRKGEVAYVRARISIIRGPDGFEGLANEELLLELASDQERGWFDFKKPEDAVEWERRIASVAPGRAAELATRMGATLLSLTEQIRSLAGRYASNLRETTTEANQDFLEFQLSQIATPEQNREATHLAESFSDPGDSSYQVGALTLMLFSEKVEGNSKLYFKRSACDDPELHKLFVILVDRINNKC
jgi:hypothetical protein